MGIGLEWAAAWKPWEVRPIINSRRRRKEMNAEAARTRQRLRRWAFRWAREQKPFSPPATEVCGASDPAGLHRAEVPAAAGVAAPPRLRPGPAAPTDPFSRPPPAPRRWTPFPEEGAAVARPRARPRPPATWRQEASIPAEEKKKKKGGRSVRAVVTRSLGKRTVRETEVSLEWEESPPGGGRTWKGRGPVSPRVRVPATPRLWRWPGKGESLAEKWTADHGAYSHGERESR